MKIIKICIAGLGNVGSNVAFSLINNHDLISKKTDIEFNIIAISAKNKSKKRIFNTSQYQWYDNPLELVEIPNCDVLIELIGEEKGLSFNLVKKAIENKIHVITANKAMLSINGYELFCLAEKTLLLPHAHKKLVHAQTVPLPRVQHVLDIRQSAAEHLGDGSTFFRIFVGGFFGTFG